MEIMAKLWDNISTTLI